MPTKKTSTPKPAATATKTKSKANQTGKTTNKQSSAKTSTVKKTTVSKKSSTPKKSPNFLGLPERYASQASARTFIIPVPYEATTTYGKGTKNGPKAIIEASQEIELFDDELWAEPHKIGIHTTSPISMTKVSRSSKAPFKKLEETVNQLIETDKFPIILGGEHSITLGAIKGCAARYKDLSVLQIDAQANLRPEYQGNPYNRASIGYQIYEHLPNPLITQVGVRNISKEEATWLEKEHPRVNIFWARQQHKWNFQDIVDTLSDNVYLSIDLDGLESSIMPSSGNPEPGGINWYQLLELIKLVCVKRKVVAADIVELAPIKGVNAPNYLAAKAVFKLIGYRFALDLGVTKRYV